MTTTVYTNSTKRNVGLLAACQALLFTNNSTLIAINGLAGLSPAPYAALATLAAGVMSALMVRHRVDQLDLVAVLKTRES